MKDRAFIKCATATGTIMIAVTLRCNIILSVFEIDGLIDARFGLIAFLRLLFFFFRTAKAR